MPRYLPAHRELVYASGVAEIAGGAGRAAPAHAPSGGLVADRHARRRLPRQRRDGGARGALPQQFPEPLLWRAPPAAGSADRVGVEDREALDVAVAVAAAHGLRVDRPGDPARPAQRARPPAPGAGGRARGGHDPPRPAGHRLAGARARGGRASWRAQGAPVVAPERRAPARPARARRPRAELLGVRRRARPTPRTAGAALRECHEALRGFKGSLPVLGGLTEAEALLARLAAEGVIAHDEAMDLQRRFESCHAAARASCARRSSPCTATRTSTTSSAGAGTTGRTPASGRSAGTPPA